MPHYKLIYFNARGKAEPIRLLFAEANVPYEDIRVDQKDWPEMKPSILIAINALNFICKIYKAKNDFSEMPFGQLPVLDIDGKVLPQSRAMIKYLAREYRNNFI